MTVASLLGIGFDKLESLFVLSGGVCPLASGNYTLLNRQVASAVQNLCTISCDDQLERMKKKGEKDFAADATYSSRNWHANEVTVLLSNPRTKKIVARQHLLKHTGNLLFSLFEITLLQEQRHHNIHFVPILGPLHKLKEMVSTFF